MQNIIWNRKRKKQELQKGIIQSVESAEIKTHPFWSLENSDMMARGQKLLFEQIREAVPIVDAAIGKIIRLVGGFHVVCSSKEAEKELEKFCKTISVGATLTGLDQFIYCYLDDLLTYGNAAGEMIPLKSGDGLGAICNVPLENIVIKQQENPIGLEFWSAENLIEKNESGASGTNFVYSTQSKTGSSGRTFAVIRASVCFFGFAKYLSGNRAKL